VDAANVTLIREDNTAALRQRRSRAKQAANSVTGKSEQKQEYALVISENGGEDKEANMFKMLVTTLALALPVQVEAFQLNRVTGELNFNEDWTGSAGYRSTLDYHTFKCVPVKAN
jgi:hypothetical protein